MTNLLTSQRWWAIRRRPRSASFLAAATAAVVVAGGMTSPSAAHPSDAGAQAPGATASGTSLAGGGYEVTLVTGDRVQLSITPAGGYAVTTEPAPRPDGSTPPIEVTATGPGEDVYAVPADAMPHLAAGLLDRELFNVTKLARYGHLDGVPVILDGGPGTASRTLATPAGVSVTAQLTSIDAVAATVAPDGTWWREFTATTGDGARSLAGAPGPAGAVEKVWLDEVVEVGLDDSVPQIGAPDAWAAGFDGTGITVAVIDTGIDAGHPDLTDRIVATRSFVPGEEVADGNGHGTHVASIIAGSGAASGGQFVGVAPGADLVVGKALNDEGDGTLSQVIEAMEWAVLEQGADVVNLSLGGDPTDGTDPGSQAVDDLTAATGALFVIAAGNDGPGPFTVGTPGAATEALTVGSVDKSEVLAGTSSRGPRLGDHAIKPEITGPGVDVTAARAAGTGLGSPVDDFYTAASGTSMATPHVAGAAAILAQQHPDWDAANLKAALVATAADGGFTVYEQGAGRVDVSRAIQQEVLVSPVAADFGRIPWPPEGPPLTRTLTYTNLGGEPVVLDLTLTATTVDGDPVPDGGLSLDTDSLTVPAGGTADVTATLDHTIVPSGRYTGRIVAAGAGDLTVVAPLGFTIDEPMFTLDVELPVREGVDDFRHFNISVWGVDGSFTGESARMVCPCPDGAEFVLPAGVYHVLSWVSWTGDDGQQNSGGLIDPEVVVTGDTGIVLDANQMSRISVETEQPSQPLAASIMAVFRASADGSHRLIATLGSQVLNWWLTPTESITAGEFFTASHWLLAEPVTDGNPGYVYQLKLYEDDRVPDSLDYRFDDKDLARIDNVLHADQPGTPMRLTWFRWRPVEFAAGGISLSLTGPATVREYAGPVSATDTHDRRLTVTPPVGFFPENALDVFDLPARHRTHWNVRPFAPAGAVTLPEQVSDTALTVPFPLWVCAGCRQGDTLYPFVHRTSREPRHTLGRFGTTFDDFFGLATVHLFRDGVEIPQAPPFFGAVTTYELPPESARYRLTLDTEDTATAWEFESESVTGDSAPPGYFCPETGFGFSTRPCAPQPLIFLRYHVDVDGLNTVPAPGAHQVEVTPYRQAAGGPAFAGLKLWYSTDGGDTWLPARGVHRTGDSFTGTVVVPPLRRTGGGIALRAEAWDAGGNRIKQTILDAYGLHDRTAD